jgi:hypothetical protein
MLSLSHLKSKYANNPNEEPWETETRLNTEANLAASAAKKAANLAAAAAAGYSNNASSAKGAFFAQARVAHPGGSIVSNKMEATYKFLKRKQEKGLTLTAQEMDVIQKFVGGDSGGGGGVGSGRGGGGGGGDEKEDLLRKLSEKAIEEKAINSVNKISESGGGANKDLRVFSKHKNGNDGSGGGGKKGKKGKNNKKGWKNDNKNDYKNEKKVPVKAAQPTSKKNSASFQERLSGGLMTAR